MTRTTGKLQKHTARCMECPWTETYLSDLEAKAGANWHVYDQHRATWNLVIGDRPPHGERPTPDYPCASGCKPSHGDVCGGPRCT